MARITGLGPWGISSRAYDFDVVVAPPIIFHADVPPRGGFFSDVLPKIQHIEIVNVLLQEFLFVITEEELLPSKQVEPVLVELEFPIIYVPDQQLLSTSLSKFQLEFPSIVVHKESQIFHEAAQISLLSDIKVFTRDDLFEIFKYAIALGELTTTEFQIFRETAYKIFKFGYITLNSVERILQTNPEKIRHLSFELFGFGDLDLDVKYRKRRWTNAPKKEGRSDS